MRDSTRMTRIGRIFADFLTLALVGAMVLTLSGCRRDAEPTPATDAVVVESGVSALAPIALQDIPRDEEPAQATPATTAEPLTPDASLDAYPPDAEVQARGMLRIYASPDPNSLTLAEYTAGDLFTVIEPPGDVSAYPVELNGVRWYRVRAGDGLVGWVIADGIEPVAQPVAK
ncbi:MAG TPA: SH3 domain-containing protein [Caldilinea sp.]|nr:SH3 domain-containing protein [Caldilinea sp.]